MFGAKPNSGRWWDLFSGTRSWSSLHRKTCGQSNVARVVAFALASLAFWSALFWQCAHGSDAGLPSIGVAETPDKKDAVHVSGDQTIGPGELEDAAQSFSAAQKRVLQWEEAQPVTAEEEKALSLLWGRPVEAAPAAVSRDPGSSSRLESPPSLPLTQRRLPPPVNGNDVAAPDENDNGRSTASTQPKYRVVGGTSVGDYEIAQDFKPNVADEPVLEVGNSGQETKPTATTTTTAPPVQFKQCTDAATRGYSMPFSCCTVRNGDFFDPRIWHCGRIPTSLDAVFIRHFVRLPASKMNKLHLRALWIIKSMEPELKSTSGVLRTGEFPLGRCVSNDSELSIPSTTELRSMRETFRAMVQSNSSHASLSDICGSMRQKPFEDESDFAARAPVLVVITEPGANISRASAEAIARTGLIGTGNELLSVDDETPESSAGSSIFKNQETPLFRNAPAADKDATPSAARSSPSSANRGDTPSQTARQTIPDTAPSTPDSSNSSPSPLVPFGFGRAPQPPTEMALSRLPAHAMQPAFAGRPRVLGLIRSESSQSRRSLAPLNLKGPSTLRVEHGAALLFLSGASLVTNAHIRNDGTFFIGQAISEECVEEALRDGDNEKQALCRIPSLVASGSLLAREPMHMHWLQLSQGFGMQPPEGDVVWYGKVGYPPELPGSLSSTLTFFGHTEVDTILPGFSFSFRRLGFPPSPAPPRRPNKTTLLVKKPAASIDMMIYVDVFDDDGFIDCCEKYYDRTPAVFQVGGVNVKFGPFSALRKDIGDESKISEQVVIRANRITSEEVFAGLPAAISKEDAIMTNSEEVVKRAGTARDIVYFQCLDECRISHQIFKKKGQYNYPAVPVADCAGIQTPTGDRQGAVCAGRCAYLFSSPRSLKAAGGASSVAARFRPVCDGVAGRRAAMGAGAFRLPLASASTRRLATHGVKPGAAEQRELRGALASCRPGARASDAPIGSQGVSPGACGGPPPSALSRVSTREACCSIIPLHASSSHSRGESPRSTWRVSGTPPHAVCLLSDAQSAAGAPLRLFALWASHAPLCTAEAAKASARSAAPCNEASTLEAAPGESVSASGVASPCASCSLPSPSPRTPSFSGCSSCPSACSLRSPPAGGESGASAAGAVGTDGAPEGPRPLVTERMKGRMEKQGYRIVGSHSAVKLCRWTKKQLQGVGGCYKHTFYGIDSHRCMEATTSIACSNRCIFCWRHHTHPASKTFSWQVDSPDFILKRALEAHWSLIKPLRGVHWVTPEAFAEAMQPRHCALSLIGEALLYPRINEFVELLHEKKISSFLVMNGQHPDRLRELATVTQLYVSVDAPNKKALKSIDRPLFKDYWERLVASLEILREKRERTVLRMTLIKAVNDEDLEGYARLIDLARPDFIEIKGVTFAGHSPHFNLTLGHTPHMQETLAFSQRLLKVLNENEAAGLGPTESPCRRGKGGGQRYRLASIHEHTNAVLLADADRFLLPVDPAEGATACGERLDSAPGALDPKGGGSESARRRRDTSPAGKAEDGTPPEFSKPRELPRRMRWHTHIDFERFFELSHDARQAENYRTATPDWAVPEAPLRGFDPRFDVDKYLKQIAGRPHTLSAAGLGSNGHRLLPGPDDVPVASETRN
ncbi:hypothetical protein BESB_078670 [Besnoitia besnoiti]|uniref:Radical SAM core domain-containing protein n=1 Tax=Besnoitia besnoiti TaxID=94643 RepID=A0A2A9MBG2_BESBE|nr:hypothetical protein BESB_078670 [Besnoitia besnoiti]PFH33651.1 hypothetical protein BESB_078670 [Besnoitia besnoiti]